MKRETLTLLLLSCILAPVQLQNGLGNVISYVEYGDSAFSPFKTCSNSSPPVTVTGYQIYIPSYIVNVNMAPEERWKGVVADFRTQIKRLFTIIRRNTSQIFGIEGFQQFNKFMPQFLKTLPKENYEELVGISEATDLTVGEVTIFNVFLEFASRSTTIVLEDVVGRIHQGRTADFSFPLALDVNTRSQIVEILKTLVVKINFQLNSRTLYSSVQFVGHIGILTGIKKDAFSLTVNERLKPPSDTDDLSAWITERKNQKWKSLVARKVLEIANSYREAQIMLVEPKSIAPAYYILGGSKNNEGCVISRKSNEIDVWSLDFLDNGSLSWYLVQTNHDRWKKPAQTDNKVVPSMICLELFGRNDPMFTLYNVLTTTPIINKYSVYAAIIEPVIGDLNVWVQDCPDPCWPW